MQADPDDPSTEEPVGEEAAADAVPGAETPGTPGTPETSPEPEESAEPEEREWWDDPRLPWKGKPGRADIACWVGFSLTGLYSLILLPLRPVLLGANVYLLAALGGSRTSMVTIGALAATGQGNWPLGLLLGVFGTMKFDPLFWWAGKLWGRGLIEIIAGRSARSARNAARAERLAQRFGPVAIVATYAIPVLPGPVVYAAVGAAGMRLRTFLLLDLVGALALQSLYVYLGYRIGQPAIDVVNVIARYSWYISIALIVGIFANLAWQSWRKKRAASGS